MRSRWVAVDRTLVLEHEVMQIAVDSRHGNLNHLMQLPRGDIRRHRRPPPDGRLAVAERDANDMQNSLDYLVF